MSKRKNIFELPPQTKVQVLAINGEKTFLETMTYGDSLKINKKKGWIYKTYQFGFCSVKPTHKK